MIASLVAIAQAATAPAFQLIPGADHPGPAPFAGPVGLRCHDDGRLFVVDDLGHRVLVFGENGKPRSTFGRHGAGAGELLWPDAIHWDDAGLLYVADTGANRIQVWTADGNFVREFGRDASPAVTRLKKALRASMVLLSVCVIAMVVVYAAGWLRAPAAVLIPTALLAVIIAVWLASLVASPQILHNPRDVWIDADGLAYVADFGSGAVRVFDRHGTLAATIGRDRYGAGALERPVGVTISRRGLVYVTDAATHRVQVFGKSGEAVTSFGGLGSAEGAFKSPHGVAVGSDDLIYVADRGNARVQVLTPEGRPIRTLTAEGLAGTFAPAGLCLAADGAVLTADIAGHRVVGWRRDAHW